MPSRGSLLRLVALAVLLVAAVTGLHHLLRPATVAVEQPGPLVVVAQPTLRWSDVDAHRTPALHALTRDSALGVASTYAVAPHSCSRSVWATLSAGYRVALDDATPESPPTGPVVPCPPLPEPRVEGRTATFPDFPRWRDELRSQPVPAELGRTAGLLQAHGQCVAAAGPGAALGAVRPDGTVADYVPRAQDADLTRCPVTFVSFDGPDDAGLEALVRRLPPRSTLVVTGLADDSAPEELRAVLLHGPGVPTGSLTSASSRQPGLIRTTDLTALVVSRVSALPGSSFEGRIPRVETDPRTPLDVTLGAGHPDQPDLARRLAATATALRVQHDLVRPFFTVYVLTAVVLIGGTLVLLQQDRRRGTTIRASQAGRLLRVLSALASAIPVSTWLAGLLPWWRSDHPTRWLVVAVLGWAVALAALALLGPWRHRRAGPAGVLAAVTAVVIAADVVLGGRLQLMTMLGLQPAHGGRLHGIGNVGFALTASGALMAAALLTGRLSRRDPSAAAQVVAAIGVLAVVVDGHYALGDEAGGSLALVWGFGYLALKASGRRTTLASIVSIGGLSVLTGLVMATLDMLRPRYERSHIGDFLAGLLQDHDLSPLVRSTVVNNWAMLTSQWLNLGVPLLLVGAVWAARRPLSRLGRPLSRLERHVPLLRTGFTAVVLCWVVGFVTNDSGTSIPPAGTMLILPLVVLMTACAPAPPADPIEQPEQPDQPEQPAPAVG